MNARPRTAEASVILLGAGRPYRGSGPSALSSTPDHRRVIDWIQDAFAENAVDWHFVGGYQIKEVLERYPNIRYSVNSAWETTGSVASLFAAPLEPARIHYVSYTDVVHSRESVGRLKAADGDVVLAIDRKWRDRYERRTEADIRSAEMVRLDGIRVVAMGAVVGEPDADAEFAGLVRLSPKAINHIARLRDADDDVFRHAGIPDLIDALIAAGLTVSAVDVGNEWAELNAPQDLARFVLGTKAETLRRLRPLVRRSVIGEPLLFSVAQWRATRAALLDTVAETFNGAALAVRSSALNEDSWASANAGVFLSRTDVPGSDRDAVAATIDEVIDSYTDARPENQILIQEMVSDTAISGVAFTRVLSSGAPYYVINYDDSSGRTDTVTGGTGTGLKTLVVYRGAAELPDDANPMLSGLLDAITELEELVGHDSLDVEFGVLGDGTVHIFQLRPIALDHGLWVGFDADLDDMLNTGKRRFADLQAASAGILGRRTIFGVMPDWNPAEIIGTKPRRLAASLYSYLITNEAWATQRAEFGYRDVRPHPLITGFLGHPYVDVRASFNSFIPAGLPDELAARLVDHYVDTLVANPQHHDKIEFEIALTCLDFDFEARAAALSQAGFDRRELGELHAALAETTRHAFERCPKELERARAFDSVFASAVPDTLAPIDRAMALLDACRRGGILPFAHLARCAFVASALLRSAEAIGIITAEQSAAFMQSIRTVAHEFTEDAAAVAGGTQDKGVFIARYGHLRPGTYEITFPAYRDDLDLYIAPPDIASPGRFAPSATAEQFNWDADTRNKFSQALGELGLPDDPDHLDAFLRMAIEGREYAKFVFTRYLSAALDALAELGDELNLDREALSHVEISEFMTLRAGMMSGPAAEWLARRAEEGRRAHRLTQSVELPPMLTCARDFEAFHHPESDPNFISLARVTAEIADLTIGAGNGDPIDLIEGRIVLIPQADPGYDWIFARGIAGLITMYGGANSHMAIRSGELGLPAAIGVGEAAYEHLRHAGMVELDATARRIRVVR